MEAVGGDADFAAEAELAKERYRLKLEEIEHRAEQETGLGLERLIAQFGPDTPVPGFEEGEEERPYVRADVEKRHREATKQLNRIGTVNPLALEEYEALKERHQFLEKQIADIESSRKDLMQLVDEVDEQLSAAGLEPKRREGNRENRWVLLDYGNFVVHIQRDAEREFYGLDRLYADCPAIEVEGLEPYERPAAFGDESELREATNLEDLPLAGEGPAVADDEY